MTKPIIALIVAHAKDGVIGLNGKMPWHIPEDLKHFKEVTMGHPVIMGRKTYESIGRLLPGRKNIIITHRHDYKVSGAIVVNSLNEGIKEAGDVPKIFVIGGAQIYQLALPYADEIWVTKIEAEIDGDTFFPNLNPMEWHRKTLFTIPATDSKPSLLFYHFTHITI